MLRYHIFTILLIVCFYLSNGQVITDSNKNRITDKYPRPQVILFMLHLSTNKIEGMKKRGMDADIPNVMASDAEANRSIMKAFSNYFTFCPVYFFYDTCYEKAKNKKWSQIDFYDYESLAIKKKVNTGSFPTYFFAEIGYSPTATQLDTSNTISDRRFDRYQGDEDDVASRNYGINVYDTDFVQLKGKLHFTPVAFHYFRKLIYGEVAEFDNTAMEAAKKFEKRLEMYFGLSVKE